MTRQATSIKRTMEYRRNCQVHGQTPSLTQMLWYFDECCGGYPTRNFVVRRDKPPEDQLCTGCGKIEPNE